MLKRTSTWPVIAAAAGSVAACCLWLASAVMWDGHSPIVLLFMAGCWGIWLLQLLRPVPLQLWLVLAVAVTMRAVGFIADPLFENDWARYLWDGYQWLDGRSPYGLSPAASFGADPRLETALGPALNHLNYPELPTVYGPHAQTVFAVSALLERGNLMVLKAVLGLHELIALVLMYRLVSPRVFQLYACCPLIISEVWFNAHLDSISLMWIVAGLWCVQQAKTIPAGLCWGIALATRVYVWPIIALYAWWRRQWSLLIVSLFTAAVLYAPHLLTAVMPALA